MDGARARELVQRMFGVPRLAGTGVTEPRAVARFRVHGVLAAFLSRERRNRAFEYTCARAATLKNAIEAVGVPHTEVARILVNGAAATFERIVRANDTIELFPWTAATPQPLLDDARFIADAHLGGLARFLRMLGFDTSHDGGLHDSDIRRIAWDDRRTVLTRDRELLKCRDIRSGCYVHALKAEAQLVEVVERFDLAPRAQPFTLCLRCNRPLEPVAKAEALHRLPEKVAQVQERFVRCPSCLRIYWPGSHYARMRAALGRLLPVDALPGDFGL